MNEQQMMNNLDRNAIAYKLLPLCLEISSGEDAAAIAFQTADDYLEKAQKTKELPVIKVLDSVHLYDIVGVVNDDIILSRGHGNVYLPMKTFFNACGKAFGGFSNE